MPDGQWGNLVVTTLDRDNGLLRYDLEEAAMLEPADLPARRDEPDRVLGRSVQGPAVVPGRPLPGERPREGDRTRCRGWSSRPSSSCSCNPAGSHDALRVRVEVGASGGDAHDVAARVTAAIKDALGIDAAVDVLDRGALPRSATS